MKACEPAAAISAAANSQTLLVLANPEHESLQYVPTAIRNSE
jgi:hypothetical protein